MQQAGRARQALILLAHFAVVALIGLADYLSGPDIELRPLHLLPVVSAAWFGGRWAGIVVSVAATIALFFAAQRYFVRGIVMTGMKF